MSLTVAYGQQPVPGKVFQPGNLLIRAVRTLESYRSVSARISQETYIYDKHLVGSGIYLGQWKDQDYLMRMELRIQLGDQTGSLVQVCDGRFLWTRRKMPGYDGLTRIDVAKVKARLNRSHQIGGQTQLGTLPGIGGMPRLFRSLHGAFDFTTAERGTWGGSNQPIWRIQGHWKRSRLIAVLPGQKAALEAGRPADLSKLPPHLPDHVVVFLLATEKPFPYRVEYRRTLPTALPSDAFTSRTLMKIELSDIDIDLPIDPNRFVYHRGNLEFADETHKLLQSLGVE